MPHPVISPLVDRRQSGLAERLVTNEATSSGVSWAAVIGGAATAAAISLILLALGAGVGLSSISPWSNAGASAATASKTAIVWLIVSQIVASAMGGYLAGRLRTKWVNIHTDEVYFRDTAHGFLVWAVGLVITAAFLTSAATSIAGGAAQMSPAQLFAADPNVYFVDALFRSDRTGQDRIDDSVRAEVGTILVISSREPGTPQDNATLLERIREASQVNE